MAKFDAMVFGNYDIIAVSTSYTIEEARRIALEWLGAPSEGYKHEVTEGWVRWEFGETGQDAGYRLYTVALKNAHPVYMIEAVSKW